MNYHTLLAHFPKITYSRYKKLTTYFLNLAEVFEMAELGDLIKAGWEEAIADEFINWREHADWESIFSVLAKEKITAIAIGQPEYPKLLTEIPDPPHTLFVRGVLSFFDQPYIAIVGTRNFSAYGKQVCQNLVNELANQQMIIVSGLALGIDGIAHQATLAKNGKTVAVLGSGINKDAIYPGLHKNLAEQIVSNGGALVSEYPPGFRPTNYSFPARNRIIAGLTLGTIVIEAPLESGSLITAKYALDYNREVMAIPHPVTSIRGEGCNKLLKLGATLVTSFTDVTDVLNLKNVQGLVKNQKPTPSSSIENAILNTLSQEPVHIDLIIKQTNLDSHIITSNLLLMEMKGMVRNVGGMKYIVK
jgi:DNA processing protein